MRTRIIILLSLLAVIMIGLLLYLSDNWPQGIIKSTKLQSLPDKRSQQIQKDEITEIKLTIDAPFSIATITIDNQGGINYEARPHEEGYVFTTDSEGRIVGLIYDESQSGKNDIKESSKIKITQYNELVSLIKASNFFSFKDKYFEENLADATTYTITVQGVVETKSVSCYGECPNQLVEIRNKIKELWGKEVVEIGV